METKQCSCCKQIKLVSDFYKKLTGLQSSCKICTERRKKERRVKASKEEKEKHRIYQKQWRSLNKEKNKKYRDSRKEKLSAEFKEYYKNNKHKFNAYSAKRKAQKIQATPSWADTNSILDFYECCKAFSLYTGKEYHVDHIVPLQSKLVCGLHCEANLQILASSENIRKSNRHWPDMP
jgi:hypothetical protein